MLIALLLIELLILFFISRRLTEHVYLLALILSRSRPVAISFVTLLLFPGTVIHELAHLFTAEVLGVHTGKLTLAPEAIRGDLSAQAGEVQAGSVAIARTDPFRKATIGIAPLITGLVAYSMLSYWLPQLLAGLQIIPVDQWLTSTSFYLVVGTLYLLFATSNSLFPSSLDLEGTPATFITIGVLLIAAYVAGIRISLNGQALAIANRILTSLTQSTMLVLALNGALLLTIWILLGLSGKVLKRKVI